MEGDDPGILRCVQCGTMAYKEDTATEERIKAKHTKQQTAIIAANKKKKKHFDQSGNEINDEQLLKDIARGVKVISYHEQKSGKERHIVHK
jgi:soluble P-type ATPase